MHVLEAALAANLKLRPHRMSKPRRRAEWCEGGVAVTRLSAAFATVGLFVLALDAGSMNGPASPGPRSAIGTSR